MHITLVRYGGEIIKAIQITTILFDITLEVKYHVTISFYLYNNALEKLYHESNTSHLYNEWVNISVYNFSPSPCHSSQ